MEEGFPVAAAKAALVAAAKEEGGLEAAVRARAEGDLAGQGWGEEDSAEAGWEMAAMGRAGAVTGCKPWPSIRGLMHAQYPVQTLMCIILCHHSAERKDRGASILCRLACHCSNRCTDG